MSHSYGAGHKAGLQAEPIRHTDGITGIDMFKPDARSGKHVKRRRFEPFVAGTAHHAGVLLIGHYKKDIRRLKFLRIIPSRCRPAKHQSGDGSRCCFNEFSSFHFYLQNLTIELVRTKSLCAIRV
jgi:hypothetical protein